MEEIETLKKEVRDITTQINDLVAPQELVDAVKNLTARVEKIEELIASK